MDDDKAPAPLKPEPSASGCTCPGHARGRHGLLCERLLRDVFGEVADAPAQVQQMLRERGRLVTGTVVTDYGELEA